MPLRRLDPAMNGLEIRRYRAVAAVGIHGFCTTSVFLFLSKIVSTPQNSKKNGAIFLAPDFGRFNASLPKKYF